MLITGGCGFVGTNLAHRVMSGGQRVILFDNLSRPGVEKNLAWLKRTHGDRMRVEAADVLDAHALRGAVDRAGRVFHLAAQVAVTTSLVNAMQDFEVNARGTLGWSRLDIGCSAGFYSVELARRGASVLGIDVNERPAR